MADCVERGGDVCDNEEGGMRMRGNVCMTVKYCSDSPDGQGGRKGGKEAGNYRNSPLKSSLMNNGGRQKCVRATFRRRSHNLGRQSPSTKNKPLQIITS